MGQSQSFESLVSRGGCKKSATVSSYCHCLSLREYEEEDMETIVWGDYLKHNCFKSWFLLRLHLEYNEGSKEVGMKIRTVHNCFESLSLFVIERI